MQTLSKLCIAGMIIRRSSINPIDKAMEEMIDAADRDKDSRESTKPVADAVARA